MITIYDYISGIYNDFLNNIESSPKLCRLKSVNFDRSCLPDYSNPFLAEYYLLRYAFAYCFEYSYIFSKVLPKHRPLLDSRLKILSIGCGSYLDYYGIGLSADTNGLKSKIVYDGVDLIDWAHKIPNRKKDAISFFQGNVVDFLKRSESLDYDFIVFPKSIGEFSNEDFRNICSCFKKKQFIADRFYLIVSLRASDQHLQYDLSRTNDLVAAIKGNCFSSFSFPGYEKNHYNTFRENAIKSIDVRFDYPNHVLQCVSSLSSYCNQHLTTGHSCDGCEKVLNRYPILRANHIHYVIVDIAKRR